MTETSTNEKSQTPASLAWALGFLTVGVGILRSVEPTELILRAIVVTVVSSCCIRLVMTVWTTWAE